MTQYAPSDLQNVHQGYPNETFVRFLKAREWNVFKAQKMVFCILATCILVLVYK